MNVDRFSISLTICVLFDTTRMFCTDSRHFKLILTLCATPLLDVPPVLAQTDLSSDSLQAEVTSVSELSDVIPTDWAFQALQSLVERYGCIAGYPDRSFRGNRSLSRYEFAAGLNACLNQIEEFIQLNTATVINQADLATLQRLQQEFARELATLRGRVDQLEARTNQLEANQFSTTTRLAGQAIFSVNGGVFNGDQILAPSGAVLSREKPNLTVLYRVAIDLDTSFSGTDLLKIRLDTGSNGGRDNATGVLEPNFGSVLDYSVKPPSNGDLGLSRLYYTFQPVENLTVSIGPDIRTTDYVDRNSYANLSFRDFSTLALVNNFILFPINGPSAGAAIDWKSGGSFSIRALYAAADPANPSTGQQPIRGAASFTQVLYFNRLTNLETLGDRGLFGDTYQGTVEAEYAPSNAFAVRLQYSGGKVFDNRFDVFGINAEFKPSAGVALFGRYGFGRYSDTAFGDVSPNYWMAGVAFPDLLKKGALAGLAAGQPFIESAIGNATQTNFEAFYNFPVSDNVSITPTLQVITNAGNRNENGTIFTGTLRTVFLF